MEPGTLIFTDIGGRVLNNVLDLNWLHVLIALDGTHYEATWPVVKRSCCYKWRRRVIVPPPWPLDEAAMKKFADSQLGRKYSFRGYFVPRLYGKTKGIYCSQFACYTLIAGGAPIRKIDGYSPDTLLRAVRRK